MLTDFLTYLQGMTGGYITPYGFYLLIDEWRFFYFKDLAIYFLVIAAIYYWFRFHRVIRVEKSVDESLHRIPDTGIVMNIDRMGMGKKSAQGGVVPLPIGISTYKKKAASPIRSGLPGQGKNFEKSVERLLVTAVRTGYEVTIEYINREGVVSERDILPRDVYSRYNKT